MKIRKKNILESFVAAILTFFCLVPLVLAQARSFVIVNVSIADGSGNPAFKGNVRVKNGKIAKVGAFSPEKKEKVIDAFGLVLAPGFIDIHNHSESGLLSEGTAGNQVSQGITTIIVGPDGGSPFPLKNYFKTLKGKIAPNVGAFMGHATLREQVMDGDYLRTANEEEISRMSKLLRQAMREGSFGLSTGLEYDIGFSASTEEIIALAKVASKYGGIYMTHMRDEEEGLLDAIRESIRIGKEAGIPVQISHLKAGNRNVWGKSAEAIKLISEEKRRGADITADAYPYTAWASSITVLVPSRRFEDREEIEKSLVDVGGADKVLITSCKAHRDYEGKTLEEIANSKDTDAVDIYMEIVRDGGAGVVCNSMKESDVEAFFRQPWVMVSSDGGIGSRHPRGAGTFTRVIGRFVRQNGYFSLEEAIRKMSLAPAQRLGLKNRGKIAKGMHADMVIFDGEAVIDNATFTNPQALSTGILMVFVNGEMVWDKDHVTGNLPGKIIRH